MQRTVDAVVDVYHSPLALQPLAIRTAVPRAATVIDVEYGEAAASPELRLKVEPCRGGARRTAVTHHQERRELARGGAEVAVAGAVQETVGGAIAFRWELDGLGNGEIARRHGGVARSS